METLSEYEFQVMQALIKKGYSFNSLFEFESSYNYWKSKKIIKKNDDPKIYAYRIDRFEKNIINVSFREFYIRLKIM